MAGRPAGQRNAICLRRNKTWCFVDINDVTYAINGAVFEVNRVLGPGFLEKVYENALLIELKRKRLKAESQAPIKVSYKGNTVGEYVVDILVEGKVIVELKTVEKLEKAQVERMVLNLPEGHDTK